MEVTKFWTKGKIIFLLLILLIAGGIAGGIFLNNNNKKKEYIKLENQLNSNASNYLKLEGITLDAGEWREINIKDIFAKQLVISEHSDDCKGYIIASVEDEYDIEFNTYIKCKNIYTTKNYGTKLSSKTKNTAKTQSQNDTTEPEIKLIGKETMNVKLNGTFKDPGVVATDNVDGDITSKVSKKGTVDTTKEGSYTITYTVSDKAGNKASITRDILVMTDAVEEEGDTTKPVISFKSNITSTICTGEKIDTNVYGTYGYSAYDDVDGDITKNVKISGSTGIMNSVGTYKITYTVTDSEGNKTTETRTFNVRDCNSKNTTVTEPTPVAPTKPKHNATIKVTSMSLSSSSYTLSMGGTFKIIPYLYPSNSTNKNVKYSSNNPSVATVDSEGNVTGRNSGTAEIIVTSVDNATVTASCTVTVN